MRRIIPILLVLALGCTPTPRFTDEAEELRYLTGQANLSVQQFQRKEALQKKAAEAQRKAEIREAIDNMKSGPSKGKQPDGD